MSRNWLRGAAALMIWASQAQAMDPADEAALRTAITGQIDAFRHDDAERAYGYASPGIRSMFGTAERFLDMVRNGYRPVYRPDVVEFGPTRDGADGPEQAVRIRDAAGIDWDAVYSFERDETGTWRISGCRLVKRAGEAV